MSAPCLSSGLSPEGRARAEAAMASILAEDYEPGSLAVAFPDAASRQQWLRWLREEWFPQNNPDGAAMLLIVMTLCHGFVQSPEKAGDAGVDEAMGDRAMQHVLDAATGAVCPAAEFHRVVRDSRMEFVEFVEVWLAANGARMAEVVMGFAALACCPVAM